MEKGGENSAGIVMSSSTGGQGREGDLVSVATETRGCFLMWHASGSSESLMCKFSCWSRMVTSHQSTLWPAFHACSANAAIDPHCPPVLIHPLTQLPLGHSYICSLRTGCSRPHLTSACLEWHPLGVPS